MWTRKRTASTGPLSEPFESGVGGFDSERSPSLERLSGCRAIVVSVEARETVAGVETKPETKAAVVPFACRTSASVTWKVERLLRCARPCDDPDRGGRDRGVGHEIDGRRDGIDDVGLRSRVDPGSSLRLVVAVGPDIVGARGVEA
jgi:hypothetical protein